MKSINEPIKQLHVDYNLTQTELADKVGLSNVQIGRNEKRKSNPSSYVLQQLTM